MLTTHLARALRTKGKTRSTGAPLASTIAPFASRESHALHASAALLTVSVLTDSALEHYRGEFKNPGMYTPLVTALATLVASTSGALSRAQALPGTVRSRVYATAAAVGCAGLAFHLYNILKRPGRVDWSNLFYGAPLGAPAALSLAGATGLAADALHSPGALIPPQLLGFPAARVLAALTSIGLLGTVGEAGLLHFRGAFQNPFMWLPVTVPPIAAALMARVALARDGTRHGWLTRGWLYVTAFLGLAGVGFHSHGVARQMGGWRNWTQNVLSGPPLPAPPSFTALALTGLTALSLANRHEAQQG
jgi:hypothetical protein